MNIVRNERMVMKTKYEKPVVRKIKVAVKVNTNASERSSCEGGHCVKARYGQDQ